ncbi:MAG: hypothetical protein KC636_18830, partial [Myxococcales bacterium]|nr:hypothetical protein [Myxococcales bacterium]
MSKQTEHERDGLLDVEEDARRVVLAGEPDVDHRYPPGTFRAVVSGMITLLTLIAATYVLPALVDRGVIPDGPLVEFAWRARPWTLDDPVPFWNLL